MNLHCRGLGLKTAVFLAIVVLSNLAGNFFLRVGMREMGQVLSLSPMPYLRALLNPWVLPGVLLLIVCLVSQLALLSWADLSYVIPMTSIGYVLTALAGKLLLHEPISAPRWAGILLIAGGVSLVSRTAPRSVRAESCGGCQ